MLKSADNTNKDPVSTASGRSIEKSNSDSSCLYQSHDILDTITEAATKDGVELCDSLASSLYHILIDDGCAPTGDTDAFGKTLIIGKNTYSSLHANENHQELNHTGDVYHKFLNASGAKLSSASSCDQLSVNSYSNNDPLQTTHHHSNLSPSHKSHSNIHAFMKNACQLAGVYDADSIDSIFSQITFRLAHENSYGSEDCFVDARYLVWLCREILFPNHESFVMSSSRSNNNFLSSVADLRDGKMLPNEALSLLEQWNLSILELVCVNDAPTSSDVGSNNWRNKENRHGDDTSASDKVMWRLLLQHSNISPQMLSNEMKKKYLPNRFSDDHSKQCFDSIFRLPSFLKSVIADREEHESDVMDEHHDFDDSYMSAHNKRRKCNCHESSNLNPSEKEERNGWWSLLGYILTHAFLSSKQQLRRAKSESHQTNIVGIHDVISYLQSNLIPSLPTALGIPFWNYDKRNLLLSGIAACVIDILAEELVRCSTELMKKSLDTLQTPERIEDTISHKGNISNMINIDKCLKRCSIIGVEMGVIVDILLNQGIIMTLAKIAKSSLAIIVSHIANTLLDYSEVYHSFQMKTSNDSCIKEFMENDALKVVSFIEKSNPMLKEQLFLKNFSISTFDSKESNPYDHPVVSYLRACLMSGNLYKGSSICHSLEESADIDDETHRHCWMMLFDRMQDEEVLFENDWNKQCSIDINSRSNMAKSALSWENVTNVTLANIMIGSFGRNMALEFLHNVVLVAKEKYFPSVNYLRARAIVQTKDRTEKNVQIFLCVKDAVRRTVLKFLLPKAYSPTEALAVATHISEADRPPQLDFALYHSDRMISAKTAVEIACRILRKPLLAQHFNVTGDLKAERGLSHHISDDVQPKRNALKSSYGSMEKDGRETVSQSIIYPTPAMTLKHTMREEILTKTKRDTILKDSQDKVDLVRKEGDLKVVFNESLSSRDVSKRKYSDVLKDENVEKTLTIEESDKLTYVKHSSFALEAKLIGNEMECCDEHHEGSIGNKEGIVFDKKAVELENADGKIEQSINYVNLGEPSSSNGGEIVVESIASSSNTREFEYGESEPDSYNSYEEYSDENIRAYSPHSRPIPDKVSDGDHAKEGYNENICPVAFDGEYKDIKLRDSGCFEVVDVVDSSAEEEELLDSGGIPCTASLDAAVDNICIVRPTELNKYQEAPTRSLDSREPEDINVGFCEASLNNLLNEEVELTNNWRKEEKIREMGRDEDAHHIIIGEVTKDAGIGLRYSHNERSEAIDMDEERIEKKNDTETRDYKVATVENFIDDPYSSDGGHLCRDLSDGMNADDEHESLDTEDEKRSITGASHQGETYEEDEGVEFSLYTRYSHDITTNNVSKSKMTDKPSILVAAAMSSQRQGSACQQVMSERYKRTSDIDHHSYIDPDPAEVHDQSAVSGESNQSLVVHRLDENSSMKNYLDSQVDVVDSGDESILEVGQLTDDGYQPDAEITEEEKLIRKAIQSIDDGYVPDAEVTEEEFTRMHTHVESKALSHQQSKKDVKSVPDAEATEEESTGMYADLESMTLSHQQSKRDVKSEDTSLMQIDDSTALNTTFAFRNEHTARKPVDEGYFPDDTLTEEEKGGLDEGQTCYINETFLDNDTKFYLKDARDEKNQNKIMETKNDPVTLLPSCLSVKLAEDVIDPGYLPSAVEGTEEEHSEEEDNKINTGISLIAPDLTSYASVNMLDTKASIYAATACDTEIDERCGRKIEKENPPSIALQSNELFLNQYHDEVYNEKKDGARGQECCLSIDEKGYTSDRHMEPRDAATKAHASIGKESEIYDDTKPEFSSPGDFEGSTCFDSSLIKNVKINLNHQSAKEKESEEFNNIHDVLLEDIDDKLTSNVSSNKSAEMKQCLIPDSTETVMVQQDNMMKQIGNNTIVTSVVKKSDFEGNIGEQLEGDYGTLSAEDLVNPSSLCADTFLTSLKDDNSIPVSLKNQSDTFFSLEKEDTSADNISILLEADKDGSHSTHAEVSMKKRTHSKDIMESLIVTSQLTNIKVNPKDDTHTLPSETSSLRRSSRIKSKNDVLVSGRIPLSITAGHKSTSSLPHNIPEDDEISKVLNDNDDINNLKKHKKTQSIKRALVQIAHDSPSIASRTRLRERKLTGNLNDVSAQFDVRSDLTSSPLSPSLTRRGRTKKVHDKPSTDSVESSGRASVKKTGSQDSRPQRRIRSKR